MSDNVNGTGGSAGAEGGWDGPERRHPQPDAFAAARDLQASMSDLGDEIRDLHTYGHRNRQLIAALGALFVIVVLLLVFTIFLAIKAQDATSLAAQNRERTKVTCLASNESRAAQVRLWTYVIDVSAANNPTPTPQEQRFFDDFRAYIKTVFAARDCDDPNPSVITATPPVPPTGLIPRTPTTTPTMTPKRTPSVSPTPTPNR